MQRDSFDDILQRKLYDNTVTPPAWDDMEKRLILAQREQGLPARKPLWTRQSNFLRYAAAVLIASTIGFGLFQTFDTPEEIVTASSKIISNEEIIPIRGTDEATSSKFTEITSTSKHDARNTLGKLMTSARSITVVNENHVSTATVAINEKPSNTPIKELLKTEANNKKQPSEQSTQSAVVDNRRSYSDGFDWNNDTRKERKSWIASAFTGALSSNQLSSSISGSDIRQFNAALVEANFTKNTASFTGEKLNHRMPVSFGLSIRKDLANKLSVEAGITYTYMEAFADINGEFLYKRNQYLHYIGIPVSINYSLLNKRSFDLYLTGGMTFEKAVSARITTDIYMNNTLASSIKQDLKTNGLLCSANAGLGMGYYFVDNFGIYAEAGINYYIPNVGQPTSYRTANPWSFNLRAGFRFRF